MVPEPEEEVEYCCTQPGQDCGARFGVCAIGDTKFIGRNERTVAQNLKEHYAVRGCGTFL